jgi:hypothetical protein
MGFSFHSYEPFLIIVAVGVVAQILFRLIRMTNPVIRQASSEPIVYRTRVWLRVLSAPNRWRFPILGRWELIVRTSSLQASVRNWGQWRGRAAALYFLAADTTMWTARFEEKDCIFLSSTNPAKPKAVLICFSADDRNAPAWDALSVAGVRAVPAPTAAPGPPSERGQ